MAGTTKLLTAGGGGVNITAASSIASDVTVNVPVTGVDGGTLVCSDSSGNVAVGTGNLSFNSGYGSNAVAYGCRAWVNFNGTGTVAIRGSGNVSSITDGGVGTYIVNFTNAMPDADYAACALTGQSGAVYVTRAGVVTRTLSACDVITTTTTANVDVTSAYLAVFR